MTYSMTGYGKTVCQYNGRGLTIEIRTLNSKQGDVNVRMPSIYREKEIALRDLISSELQRGKIDLSIQRDLADEEMTSEINEALVTHYYEMIKRICIDHVKAFRKQEGAKLELVLRAGAERIASLLEDVAPFEQARIDKIRGRITNSLGDDADASSFDKDRFEQELIYYLEKLDITEEKVRLKAHCEYFLKTLDTEEVKGKKLSFIAQEMGREINTLGSKAQHSEMQRVVVDMKDELEKIKEQVLNVL